MEKAGKIKGATYAIFRLQMTVNEAVEKLRVLVKTAFITYGYVTDPDQKLLGLVTMRDLLFAEWEAQLAPEPLQKLHFKVESAIQ